MPTNRKLERTIKEVVMGNYDNAAPLDWDDDSWERKKWINQKSKEPDNRPLTEIYTDSGANSY